MRGLRAISRIRLVMLGIIALIVILALAVGFALPHLPWLAQPTVRLTPADGATDVVPRSPVVLAFSQPMNRHSVEQALDIVPPTAGTFVWDDAGQTLRFIPTPAFTAGLTHTVSLDTGARSRWWLPLAEPVQVAFRTLQSPTVVAALPNADTIPTDTPLALVFSQPMVPPEQLDTPVELPQLQVEPPLTGEARWVAVDTLLLRPTAPLKPDMRYQATLTGLTDVRGVDLEAPVTWSWSTQGPTLLSHTPGDGDPPVAPRQPLVVTLAQPLDQEHLRARLVITPTVPLDLATTLLPTGTQIVTFTPTVDWEPGRTYDVAFKLTTQPATSSTQDTAVTWTFTAAPLPALVGSFPGQNQLLPPGQSVRLIFNTPIEAAAVSAGLTVDPPVENLQVSVEDTTVRLLAEWQPMTDYTLTVDPTVTDQNGVALGQAYRLVFRTASAAASLRLPEVQDQVVSMLAGEPVTLALEHTNLSALDLELYRLDEATLLRTVSFSPADWNDFRPERYNQPRLRAWRVSLDNPPDQPVRAPLPLAESDDISQPLPAGAYYLRITTPEGPEANLVVLVTNVELLLKQSATQVLVWAVDRTDGTPLADLPLTLYRGDAVVARGRSNGNGIWEVAHNRRSNDLPYIVVAGDPAPAVVSSAWRVPVMLPDAALADSPRYRSLLFTSRPAYAPGETVQVAGLVRQVAPDGSLDLPRAGTPLDLVVQSVNASVVVTRTTIALPGSGVVSASLGLDLRTPPGAYLLQATIGDTQTQVPLWVTAPEPPFTISFEPAGALLPVRITSATVPVSGAELSWQLRAIPIEPPPPPGLPESFQLGDPEAVNDPVSVQTGRGLTDAAGQFAIPLVDPATLTQTLRYEVTVQVQEPGGPQSAATTFVTVEPAGTRVALRLPNRIMSPGDQAVVEALALDAQGRPAPAAPITLELYRRTWNQSPTSTTALIPQDTLALTRNATADDQGRLRLELPMPGNGEYRLVARAGALSTAAAIWVTTPGYTGWFDTGTQVEVVTDRAIYQPGDTAQLLVTTPFEVAAALVTLEQNGRITSEVRTLRAGQPLDISITPAMAPNTYVSLFIVQQGAGNAPISVRLGYTALHVVTEPPALTTTITPDQATYLPGETATVTITTRTAQGQGVAADLLLAVTAADQPDVAGASEVVPLPQQFAPDYPAATLTAAGMIIRAGNATTGEPPVPPRTAPEAGLPFDPSPSRVVAWNPGLRTAADGTLVLRIPLPSDPATWRVQVYAARGADRFGQASAVLTARAPLELQPQVPPFLRAGDRIEAALVVRNTTSLTQEVRATLTVSGASLEANVPATRNQQLPPGAVQRFVWPMYASTVDSAPAQAGLRFSAEATGIAPTSTSLTLPIAPSSATHTRTETLEVTGETSHQIISTTRETDEATHQPLPITCVTPTGYCPWSALELAVAPNVRAAVVRSALVLVNLPVRSVEQEASLLLLSAALAQDTNSNDAPIWRAQITRSLSQLTGAQASSGGWGQWPGDPPSPFLTGYVLEAQAAAATALALPFEPDPDALLLLHQADTAEADPDLRAYIHYVLTLTGARDPAAGRDLRDLNLGADGLAYLALTLPPAAATSPFDQLQQLAQHTPATNPDGAVRLFWEPTDNDPPAHTMVSTTALATQALLRLQPDNPQVPLALRTLRLAWGVDGWPTAFESARAATALLAAEASAARAPRPYELSFNGRTLVRENQSTSTSGATPPILLSGEQLRARNLLRIVPQPGTSNADAPLLVAYRLREQVPAAGNEAPPRVAPAALAVYQDYLDPLTGVPVNPEALRLGQLVRVRLTLITLQSLAGVTLEAPLPAPFVPVMDTWHPAPNEVPLTNAAPWSLTIRRWSNATLHCEGTDLAPGIYTQRYLVRVIAPGTFAAPPLHTHPNDPDSPPAATVWGSEGRIVVTQPAQP